MTTSSVTLIFYKVGDQWWQPALNLLAAAQFSSYTHVELAIEKHLAKAV